MMTRPNVTWRTTSLQVWQTPAAIGCINRSGGTLFLRRYRSRPLARLQSLHWACFGLARSLYYPLLKQVAWVGVFG